MEMLSMEERSKSKLRFGGTKVCEAEEVREYFINRKIENKIVGLCVNQVIYSLDFRNTLWSTSKNILSELILKYHFLMLTHPPRVSQNLFQNNKVCESSITTVYQFI